MNTVLLVPSLRLEGWRAMDRYADALASALPDVLGPGWRVTRLTDPGYPRWSRFAARWLAYPRQIRWDGWDVIHVLDHSYAHVLHGKRGSGRTVVTVHDLQALEHPEPRHGRVRRRVLGRINRWVLHGLRVADACLCDSRATLRAVTTHFPELAPRARHQPLGVDQGFFVEDRLAARDAGRQYLGVRKDAIVVLHVGSCAPRKGIDDLLRAFHRLAARDERLRLVQVGGRFSPRQLSVIRELGLNGRFLQRAFVPEACLPPTYAAADVLVMPSLFEGFGLPVLEAFAVGVPVVSTRYAALAEFPADMLFPVDAPGIDAFVAAIEGALRDSDEARQRAARARVWAAPFSWQQVARGTADAYLG